MSPPLVPPQGTAFDFRLPERSVKIAAFAAIYLIWGSTYLAIRLVAETLPGLSMMGLRFFLAGLTMYWWARWRKAPHPTFAHWRAGTIAGGLMLCGGAGGVVLAIRHLDSGLVALLIGMVPLWIAFLMWFWPGGRAPSARVVGALLIGFCGVAILAAPGSILVGDAIHLPSVWIIMLACVLWGLGSLYSRNVDLPRSPHMVSAIEMLAGGLGLLSWGLIGGDWNGFEPQAVSLLSIGAFVYLVVFGSLIAFSAYSWLIRTAEPTLVSTYAYVNPVVAIFLGWLIVDEPVSLRMLVAAALIISSVVLVTTAAARRRAKKAEAAPLTSPRRLRADDDPVPTLRGGSGETQRTEKPLEKCA